MCRTHNHRVQIYAYCHYNVLIKIISYIRLYLIKTNLYRRLKIVTGMSAAELIKTTRLHQAEKLLINSKCSIGEAATLSGFNELSYFTRIFKRHYGMTPSMYRIQAQKGNTQHKEETV